MADLKFTTEKPLYIVTSDYGLFGLQRLFKLFNRYTRHPVKYRPGRLELSCTKKELLDMQISLADELNRQGAKFSFSK